MKRLSRAKSLTILVAVTAAIGGGTAAVVTSSAAPPRAADGGAADTPPIDLNTGQPTSQAQINLARQQALSIPIGDRAAWRFVGPTNIGGRVVDLALDPTTSPTTVYAAVSSGGIMKSTDGAKTWTPAWPTTDTQAMGALARGQDGTLWAGTGEANPSGGGDTFLGNGIYKSTDGGRSWQLSGLPDSGAFGRIVVNPHNPGEVWAAASGWLSPISAQRGLYHTTNGGKTWKLALAPSNATTGAIDVAIDPANPNIILASLWDRFRNNGAFHYGGVGSGLYRSVNDGKTWTRLNNSNITGPVCSWDLTHSGLNANKDLGRIGIAFAPSKPDRVYIQSSGAEGPDKGFYVSSNAGKTWTCGAGEPGAPGAGYEWVFGRLWVDPVNANHVFAADVTLRESTNGGATWNDSSGTHADQHAMAWDPHVANLVYNGDDGGVYISKHNGANNTWTHARVEPWNQSYHLAVSQQDPKRLATGLQDQGSIATWTAGVEPTDLTQWTPIFGGDGHWVQINPNNELVYYACLQPTPPTENCARFVDTARIGPATTKVTNFSQPNWPAGTRITTDTPMVPDPADPNYVYIGGTSIARSGNRVVSGAWTLISPVKPDSAASLPGRVPKSELNPDPFYVREYGAVTQIAPAKSTGTSTSPATTIYAGTDTGKLWKTTNATASPASGVKWTQLGVGVLPKRWVTGIVVDPTNANHVFASFSNYKQGDLAANVWETTDGGATWHNISGNMPNAPVWHLAYNRARGQLYAGTDFGAFFLKNGSKSWARLGSGLPDAPVFDLKLTGDGKTIYAATFGRGIFQIPVPAG